MAQIQNSARLDDVGTRHTSGVARSLWERARFYVPFTWRFYDTRIPMDDLEAALGADAAKARGWLKAFERAGLAVPNGNNLELSQKGAFWLHLAQNYFALNYVNTLWTRARLEPWPQAVEI